MASWLVAGIVPDRAKSARFMPCAMAIFPSIASRFMDSVRSIDERAPAADVIGPKMLRNSSQPPALTSVEMALAWLGSFLPSTASKAVTGSSLGNVPNL